MQQLDFALLLLRVVLGIFVACHGINKVKGGLAGTARWFGGIGMKWPLWQARIAASTEIGASLLIALGLLTPLAAAGIIGIMLVAIWSVHWKIGFFVFHKGEGWEYCGFLAFAAFAIGTVGAGRWSLDHALDIAPSGWTGAIVAGGVGIGSAALQLSASYRPKKSA